MSSTNASNERRQPPARRCIAIAAGGTAGHVYPALAFADAYRELQPQATVLFLGTPKGLETRLVAARGHRLLLIPGSPIFGAGPLALGRAFWDLARGVSQARRLLRQESIGMVVGFGGYASAGAILAARSLGLPAAIHEANAWPGLTNRLLARLVQRVYLGSESARPAFPAAKTCVTGVPVRDEILRATHGGQRDPGRRPFRVLVTGGSLGSPFLNRKAPELLARVARRGCSLEVRHQTGPRDMPAVEAAYEQLGLPAAVEAYIDDMAATYAWADFAIACAGAVTFAELAAAGLPALLVPLARASENHQQANAREFSRAGGLDWVSEDAWSSDALAEQIAALLCDPGRRAAASRRLRSLAPHGAARMLVDECESLLRRHRRVTK